MGPIELILSKLLHESQFSYIWSGFRYLASQQNERTSLHYWNHLQWSEKALMHCTSEKPTVISIHSDKLAILQQIFQNQSPGGHLDTPYLAKQSVCDKIRPIVRWRKLLQFGVNASLESDICTAWSPPPLLSCDSWWRWNRLSSVTLRLGFHTALVNSGDSDRASKSLFWHNQQKVFVAQRSPCGECPLAEAIKLPAPEKRKIEARFFGRNLISWKKCKNHQFPANTSSTAAFLSTHSDLHQVFA